MFYAYGQKQIFYKYDAQNVNYALAKENTAYTGYVSDPAAEVDRGVASMMNTNIKKMEAEGLDRLMYLGGDDKFYAFDRLGESIYTLSLCETEKVASFGGGEVRVGIRSAEDGVRRRDAGRRVHRRRVQGLQGQGRLLRERRRDLHLQKGRRQEV